MTQPWNPPPYRDVVERVLETARSASPYAEISRQDYDGWTNVRISTSPGSAYSFAVQIYHDIEDIQICAARADGDAHEYFWYRPNERFGFESPSHMIESVLDQVQNVLAHPTRIHEDKGFLSRSFVLQYHVEGTWRSIAGAGALRFSNFKFPHLESASYPLAAWPVERPAETI